jgi:hypothetical protein
VGLAALAAARALRPAVGHRRWWEAMVGWTLVVAILFANEVGRSDGWTWWSGG